MVPRKVSVIVPCYNQGAYLSEALDSVLKQTYQNIECVIVNDGSTDNTEEVIRRYRLYDSRIKSISQENSGLASARNNGIRSSAGEFILPLDADDIISPSYIEKAVARFMASPILKLVYCKADFFGDKNGPWNLDVYDWDSFIWQNCIFCSAMYRRCDFDNTAGYNTNMKYGFEDWDFWLSLLRKGDGVCRIDEPLFHYRIKDASMKAQLLSNKKNLEETYIQLYKNHKDIYAPFSDDFMERIVFFHGMDNLLYEVDSLRLELIQIRQSKAYRLGKMLLRPFLGSRNN